MDYPTEKDKMLAGELYNPDDPDLSAIRREARALTRAYNSSAEDDDREAMLHSLLGRVGSNPTIEPPFYCDYGKFIFLGDNVYLNFGCVILDCNEVHIGDHAMLGPYVQLYAAYHPINASERITDLECSKPINIGSNVWLGGGVIVLPGVTVGDNTTIGAGSVVTKDIPPNVVAVGNPCRVIKKIE